MKHLTNTHILSAAIFSTIIMGGCSKKQAEATHEATTPIVEHEAQDAMLEAVRGGDRKQIESMVDQFAIYADDLNPRQALSVLMGYYELHKTYQSEHKYKSSLEAMRNYVDVYDIVMSNHKDNFRKALVSSTDLFPDVDFTEIYEQFVDRLSQYVGGVSDVVEAKNDSILPDTTIPNDNSDLPPELRPAE